MLYLTRHRIVTVNIKAKGIIILYVNLPIGDEWHKQVNHESTVIWLTYKYVLPSMIWKRKCS